jgi:hypothetical protein
MDVSGSGNPTAQARLAVGWQPIQRKPSWAQGRWRIRVDGDHFKEHRFAQRQKQIVRTHPRMLTALLRVNTQQRMHQSSALGQ